MANQENNSTVSLENVVKRSDFDDDFVFGSSTSSYQIEGGFGEGGKGLSIWDAFALNTPENVSDGSNGNVAANQYHMFKDDVKLMKKTGLDAYRFSISWSRVLPGGKLSTGVNKEGIKYYNDLIDTIKAEGMEPYVTLFHWDLPLALELEYGGFKSEKIVNDFRDFAELCFWEFGDRVKHWITTNEAWTYSYKGYVNGTFPPGRGSDNPKDIEKRVMTSIASRDLFTLLDLVPILGALSPLREFIEGLLTDLLKKLAEMDISVVDIEKLVKGVLGIINDKFPGFVEHILEPLEKKITKFIEDLTIGLYLEYKYSGKPQPRSEGDPGREPYLVGHNLILAHATAVDLYRKTFQVHQGGEIGMTNNVNMYTAYHPTDEDQKAAGRALDWMFYWFVHPLVTGDYPETMKKSCKDRLPSFTDEQKQSVKGSYDFLGVNIYTTYYAINMPKDPSAPLNYILDMEVHSTPTRHGKPIGEQAGSEWLYIYPQGIYDFLIDIRKRYYHENPLIYITENGVNEKTDKKQSVKQARLDPTRVQYQNDHLWYVSKAIKDKEYPVNVKAYFIWSFADNYEWAEGYDVRFGIFYIDFANGRLSRYPKTSAFWWMNFLSKTNSNNLIEGGNLLKRGRDDSIEVENHDTEKKQKMTIINNIA